MFTSSQQYQAFVAGESKIIFASGDLYLYKKNGFGSGSKMLIFKKNTNKKLQIRSNFDLETKIFVTFCLGTNFKFVKNLSWDPDSSK